MHKSGMACVLHDVAAEVVTLFRGRYLVECGALQAFVQLLQSRSEQGAMLRPTWGALATAAIMSRLPLVPMRFHPSLSVDRCRDAAMALAHAWADFGPRRFRLRSRSRSVWFVRSARAIETWEGKG